MPLSKKDYEWIAQEIVDILKWAESLWNDRYIIEWWDLINVISSFLKDDNPKFEKDKFVDFIIKLKNQNND